jgi:hypothetical protein
MQGVTGSSPVAAPNYRKRDNISVIPFLFHKQNVTANLNNYLLLICRWYPKKFPSTNDQVTTDGLLN